MNKNISPVGWYVGTYLARFVEVDDHETHNPEKRFQTWENTIVVQADDLEEAYGKIEKIAMDGERPYRGGKQGVVVQWEYMGIIDLLPIYEPLVDGAEIMWAENRPRKLKRLQSMVKPKQAFTQK